MNAQEAEKIVNAYGAALAKGGEGGVRRKSLLPCSAARIRQAYYAYIEALVNDDMLSQSIGDNLLVTYVELEAFVEDADIKELQAAMSRLREGIGSKEDEQKVMALTSPTGKMRAMQELNEYIAECIGMKSNNFL